jgi:hypothetical protein
MQFHGYVLMLGGYLVWWVKNNIFLMCEILLKGSLKKRMQILVSIFFQKVILFVKSI